MQLLVAVLLVSAVAPPEGMELEAELRMLREGSTQAVYLAGSHAIIERGPTVLAELHVYLSHQDPVLRAAALDAMAFFPEQASKYLSAVTARLRDPDVDVVSAALDLLTALGDKATPAILSVAQVLEDPRWRYRTPGTGAPAGIIVAVQQFLLLCVEDAKVALPILDRFLADAKVQKDDKLEIWPVRNRIQQLKEVEAAK